jgi:hypothetical protein
MYLVIDKSTKAILHMSNSFPGEEKKPEEVFPGFEAATMEFGRSPEQYIPVNFVIENGVVRDLEPRPAMVEAAGPSPTVETLAQARERQLQQFSQRSLELRRRLIPEHQLQNAALGVYDDDRVQAIRATVQAFRDEYHRLEAAVAKARSIKALAAIEPAFPGAIVMPKSTAKPG